VRGCGADAEELGGIKSGDRAAFKYVDFGSGADRVVFRVRGGAGCGRIDLALDRPWSGAVGRVEIPEPNAPKGWRTVTGRIAPTAGVHARGRLRRGAGPWREESGTLWARTSPIIPEV
jgi:Carbohydrate binding module (family 6)